MPAFTAHPMPPPPPPPALTGLPTDDGFPDLNFAIEPTLPSTFHANAAFLLSMGEPPHPDLDKAIADGDDTRVFAELARIRNRYSQPSVTFNTAINRAIDCEQLGILNLLLDCGIQTNDYNLQAAIISGNLLITARLVEELPGSINMVFENGHTALTLAVRHEDLVVWLLSKGADPKLQDAWAETPLSCAVERECYGVIETLLDAGADVKQGAPLHMALRIKDEADSLHLMARLLALGAPVDRYQGEKSPMWDRVGFQRGTALHSASIKGNLGAVRLLLAHGADPSRKQRVRSFEIAESSALDEARNRNYTDIVSVLREHLHN
ncbi:hypothetical protein LTR56_027826 [Elasticomyces elasticus]|nr:hypothetical protein LTR56_027826 [Elasticomyces elasticus]KAK3615421.1 hypothetical protein LTR22_027443 [Elasticomyces elasticus]